MRQLKIQKSITNRSSEALDKYLVEIGRHKPGGPIGIDWLDRAYFARLICLHSRPNGLERFDDFRKIV